MQHRNDARLRDTGAHFQTQCTQVFGDVGRGLGLAIGEFRVLMDIAAIGDHVRFHLIGQPVDTGMKRVQIAGGDCGRSQAAHEDDLESSPHCAFDHVELPCRPRSRAPPVVRIVA